MFCLVVKKFEEVKSSRKKNIGFMPRVNLVYEVWNVNLIRCFSLLKKKMMCCFGLGLGNVLYFLVPTKRNMKFQKDLKKKKRENWELLFVWMTTCECCYSLKSCMVKKNVWWKEICSVWSCGYVFGGRDMLLNLDPCLNFTKRSLIPLCTWCV